MPRFETLGKYIFEYNKATLNQANPVQNTWYTILDTTANVKLIQWAFNVEDTNETLGIKLTIDGETLTGSVSATHSTEYGCWLRTNAISQAPDLAIDAFATIYSDHYLNLEGKSVKCEIRKTTATGAGNLTACITYGILKPC